MIHQSNKGRILKKLEKENFEPQVTENHDDVFKDFIQNGLEKFMEEAGLVPDNDVDNTQLTIKDLPVSLFIILLSIIL